MSSVSTLARDLLEGCRADGRGCREEKSNVLHMQGYKAASILLGSNPKLYQGHAHYKGKLQTGTSNLSMHRRAYLQLMTLIYYFTTIEIVPSLTIILSNLLTNDKVKQTVNYEE